MAEEEEGDYADNAAREWMLAQDHLGAYTGCACSICTRSKYAVRSLLLQELATIIRKHVGPLETAARCAMADLEGIMPEFEPSGDRRHPGWTTLKELQKILPA